MNEKEVRERAFVMPLTNPAYPPGPYLFVNRREPHREAWRATAHGTRHAAGFRRDGSMP